MDDEYNNPNVPSWAIKLILQKDEIKELSGYLARIEHFCVGVNQNIYDWETVYALAHGYLDGNQILSRISPIIDRKNRSGMDYYENIHVVLNRMNEKTRAELDLCQYFGHKKLNIFLSA